MLQLEILICKLLTVDTLSARAVTIGEVSTLTHELLDYSVECRTFIAEAFLASCEGAEVLGGLQPRVRQIVHLLDLASTLHLWHGPAVQTHCDSSNVLITMLNIEVHFACDLWSFLCLDRLGEIEERESAHQQQADEKTLEIRHVEEGHPVASKVSRIVVSHDSIRSSNSCPRVRGCPARDGCHKSRRFREFGRSQIGSISYHCILIRRRPSHCCVPSGTKVAIMVCLTIKKTYIKYLIISSGFHLRRQLPRKPPRLESAPIFLRHRSTSLHTPYGEISRAQHSKNRRIERQTNQ